MKGNSISYSKIKTELKNLNSNRSYSSESIHIENQDFQNILMTSAVSIATSPILLLFLKS